MYGTYFMEVCNVLIYYSAFLSKRSMSVIIPFP